MKRFSPVNISAAIMLATALVGCGSSGPLEGSEIIATGNAASITTTTDGGISGNTNTTTTVTSGHATVSFTGSLGGVVFAGKDAVYAADTVNGVAFVTTVVSDSADLCSALGSQATLDGNVLVIQLLTYAKTAVTVGDYTVENSNNTGIVNTAIRAGDYSTGIASVSLLTADANSTEVDASSGYVNVIAYATNNPLVFTVSAQAAGSSVGFTGDVGISSPAGPAITRQSGNNKAGSLIGFTGNVSAPPCAALATAMQSGSGITTSGVIAKLTQSRRVFITNLR